MQKWKQVSRWGLIVALAWGSQAGGAAAQFNRFARSLSYASSAVTTTPVSGRSGTPRPLNDDAEPLPIAGVMFTNFGNRTCMVKSRVRSSISTTGNYEAMYQAATCPLPTAGVVSRNVDAPAATFITGLEVCLPNTPDSTTGDRIAGVRIHLSRVQADGTVVAMSTPESATAPDCVNWQARVDCPANSLAVNVLAQTNPQGVVRGGLALSCAALVTPGLRPPLPGTNWGINLATRVNGSGFTAPSGATVRRIEADGIWQSSVLGRGSDGRVCAIQGVVRTITQGAAEGRPRLFGTMISTGLCAQQGQPVVWSEPSPAEGPSTTGYRIGGRMGIAAPGAGYTRGATSGGTPAYFAINGTSLDTIGFLPAVPMDLTWYGNEFSTRYCPSDHVVTGVIAYESSGAYTDHNVICSPVVRPAELTSGPRTRPR